MSLKSHFGKSVCPIPGNFDWINTCIFLTAEISWGKIKDNPKTALKIHFSGQRIHGNKSPNASGWGRQRSRPSETGNEEMKLHCKTQTKSDGHGTTRLRWLKRENHFCALHTLNCSTNCTGPRATSLPMKTASPTLPDRCGGYRHGSRR